MEALFCVLILLTVVCGSLYSEEAFFVVGRGEAAEKREGFGFYALRFAGSEFMMS